MYSIKLYYLEFINHVWFLNKKQKKKHHLTFKFTIKNMIKKKNYLLVLFRAQFMQTKNKQINQQTTIKQHALIL